MLTSGVQPATWKGHEEAVACTVANLPAYLLRQRWYPAKDSGAPEVSLKKLIALDQLGLSTAGEPACALAIWTAKPPGQAAFDFFMPLGVFSAAASSQNSAEMVGPLGTGEFVGDALRSDTFVRSLIRLMLRATDSVGTPTTADGSDRGLADGSDRGLRPGHTVAARILSGSSEWQIRRGSVEQSNTSIRIGDDAILKVIRKLLAGTNPELEMGRHLTERANFKAIPAMLGWLDLDGFTLAVLQRFVPNVGDGWSWILRHLRDPANATRATLPWIGTLGVRTAEMHRALAGATDDAAFAPELARPEDWQRWTRDIEAMAQRVLEGLRRRVPSGSPDEGDIAQRFADRCRELPDLLQRFLPTSAVQKTRHHGDYHLGQVLVSGDDAVIVDFEGEPMRPLNERRAKHIPLRDVAGMMRSFDYAASVVERELPQNLSKRERGEAEAQLRNWKTAAADRYLERYLSASSSSPTAAERAQATALVKFFSVEKALYEVLYELANRPTWVAIPLKSALALLDEANSLARADRTGV